MEHIGKLTKMHNNKTKQQLVQDLKKTEAIQTSFTIKHAIWSQEKKPKDFFRIVNNNKTESNIIIGPILSIPFA